MNSPRIGETMKKLAKTLGERAEMLHNRIGDDGEIRGKSGFLIDIKWARDVLDDLEREFTRATQPNLPRPRTSDSEGDEHAK